MRKTFNFHADNKKPDRQLDSIRHEIKKYFARERRKKIPTDADFWDFDCHIGPNDQELTKVQTNEINEYINKFVDKKLESFYLEILAKPGFKSKKL